MSRNEMPFRPHDKLSQVGMRELPVSSAQIKMINDTVGAAWTEVTIPNTPLALVILNTHASQYLRVSLFANGSTYFTIFPHDALKMGAKITTLYLYGEGAATTYDIIYFEQDS